MNGFPQPVEIFGTEVLGDDHTGTHGQTIEKADHHENQTAGGTDSCQSVVANKIADAPSIKGIIQLLKDLPQKQGEGEQHQCLPNRAFGQGVGAPFMRL